MCNTEAVLFVDHRERKRVKSHVAREKRVRTDHDVELPEFCHIANERTLARRQAAGEKSDFHRGSCEKPRNRREVLFSQQLGRRHERCLMPIGDSDEHRGERHRGLSCADIALQQAIHRLRIGEILRNLAERTELIGREREGKSREDFTFNFCTDW